MRAVFISLTLCLLTMPLGSALHAETASAATNAPAEREATLPAIAVTTVASRPMQERIIATGLIAPVEMVQVAPLIEGQPIEALLADVSDDVVEGQVLAVLSKTTLELQKSQFTASRAAARATIAQAEAQMLEARTAADEAQRVNERTAKLRQQGSASQAAADTASANAIAATARVTIATQSLEAARAQLALVEAQLANVELQLSRTEVKAPFAGEISARNAVIGAVASAAGAPMFSIIRDGALELRAEVTEADMLRIKVGQKANLRLVGLPDPLTGTVRLIEPTIDATTRLGKARIMVDQPDLLRSGMFAEAEIIVAARDTLAVPVTAIGTDGSTSTVMRVVNGVIERVPVTLGIRDSGWVEIVSGLAAQDQVVIKAGSFVQPGDHINPVPALGKEG
jgi:HlyD family secretion protein